MKTITNLFVGYTTKSASDAHVYIEPPKAPKNYKKADVIAEYIETEKANRLEQASSIAVTGTLVSVCILDQKGAKWFEKISDAEGETSVALIDKLLTLALPAQWSQNILEPFENPSVRIWGLSIKQVMRIAALEYCNAGYGSKLPSRLWYHNPGLLDPADILLGGDERKMISPLKLLEFLGYSLGENPIDSDLGFAKAVKFLAENGGLI